MARTTRRWLRLAAAASAAIALSAVTLADDTAREGIKVHGQWRIEVFNPDGTRVSVTEFENTLVGRGMLGMFLIGEMSPGGWGLALDSAGAKPCADAGGAPMPCQIGANDVYYGSIYLNSTNLTVIRDFAGTGKITLRGSVSAGTAASIEIVSTLVNGCIPPIAPPQCTTQANNIWQGFTRATLASPPAVVPGQLIQVTVDISFS